MSNVIVNASGAKHGGAREILCSFLQSLPLEGEDVYYVFCPEVSDFSSLSGNIKFVECRTDGLRTFLFSVVFIFFYVLSLRAKKVISFNNVNCIFAPSLVTYFHQEKAITGRGIRFSLIRIAVRLISRGEFVVQSERVKREFLAEFSVKPARVHVKWPGVRRIPNLNRDQAWDHLSKSRLSSRVAALPEKRLAILPVYDPGSTHKDFIFFSKVKSYLNSAGVVTISLCPPGSDVADVDLGKVSAEELDWIYLCCDYMVVISIHETLCLPIFEFAQTSRVILARNSPFIVDFNRLYADWLVNLKILDSDFGGGQILKYIESPARPVKKSTVDEMCRGDWGL